MQRKLFSLMLQQDIEIMDTFSCYSGFYNNSSCGTTKTSKQMVWKE
jgi:hypothetical protein